MASNKSKIKLGNSIKFYRKDTFLVGDVVQIRENTVMIEVCETVEKILNIPNNLTVVSHKNYEIIR